MKEVRLNGCTLEVYDSIDEMPFGRFQEYNRAVMIASGLGSDMDAIGQHISQARRYNALGDKDNTEQSLLNLWQSLSFVMSNISPESQAFVALIFSIDGEQVKSLSPENIQRITDRLSHKGLTVQKARSLLSYVKKKLTRSLIHSFQGWQTAPRSKSITQG